MKYSIKLAVLGALLAAGVAQAATTTVTNFEQTISFALTATIQGPTTATSSTVTTASGTTKDVIKALGNALATNFSSKAQLLLITPTNIDNNSYIVVRDVVNKTNVDIKVPSGTFHSDVWGEVTSSKVSNGKTTGTEYQINELWFDLPSLSVDLLFFWTQTIQTGAVTASGVGSGMVGTNEAVFKGTVGASAYKAVKKVVTTQ